MNHGLFLPMPTSIFICYFLTVCLVSVPNDAEAGMSREPAPCITVVADDRMQAVHLQTLA